MIYAFLMMLCVKSGSFAPYSLNTCSNIRGQVDRIREMFTTENFTPTPSASSDISTEKDFKECAVLQKLVDYSNCEVAIQHVENEIKGLIDNLKMLTCSDDEKTCDVCNVSELSCPLELSLWDKTFTKTFEKQVMGVCFQIMQHVCP